MVDLINLNKTNYTEDGVDRSRWKFDEDGVDRSRWKFNEDGFSVATAKAMETARRQVILAAEAENQKVISQNSPTSVERSIDGSPNASYDKFKL